MSDSLNSGTEEETSVNSSDVDSRGSCIDSDAEELTEANPTGAGFMSEQEKQALNILSVFLKHNLSASASKDVIKMMKKMFPDSHALDGITYESLWKVCGETSFQEFHYCSQCYNIFPDNVAEYNCSSPGCNGLRFVGLEYEQAFSKVPQKSFILADVGKQLASLLKTSGKGRSSVCQYASYSILKFINNS